MANLKRRVNSLWQQHKEVLLWAVGGGINTVLTYGLYLAFNLVSTYRVAFTTSYIIGIVFAYFFNSLVVFNTPLSLAKFLQFPVVYLVQYLLSIGFLEVFVQALKVDERLAPVFVLLIVTPVTYVLSKWILKGKSRPAGE